MTTENISEELREGLERYNRKIQSLGGYGTRIQYTTPDGIVHQGTLREGGFGGCQPQLWRDDGRRFAIANLSDVVAVPTVRDE